MSFQIVRRLIMQKFKTEQEAKDELNRIYEFELKRGKFKIADFSKNEITLNDESIIKVIEIKDK